MDLAGGQGTHVCVPLQVSEDRPVDPAALDVIRDVLAEMGVTEGGPARAGAAANR